MTQNTHNVRTRREQLATYPESVCVGRYSDGSWQLRRDAEHLDEDRLVEGPVLYVRCDIAHRSHIEAEAPVAWLIQDKSKGQPNRAYSPDRAVTDKAHADHAARFNNNVFPLYTRPANVAALEARVKKLEVRLRDALEICGRAETESTAGLRDTGAIAAVCGSRGLATTIRAALTREGGV